MQNTQISMVVTDLDGTLLSPSREISDKAVETITYLRKKNIRFSFITGRPPYAIDRFVQITGITDPVVCCNGAIVINDGQVVVQHSFSLTNLQPLMQAAADLGLTVLLYSQGTEYALSCTPWVRSREAVGKVFPIWDFAQHPKAKAEKVNIISDGKEDDFASLIPQICVFSSTMSVAIYERSGCEIVAKEANKSTGLLELCRICNVAPENTLAIGDNENDHPMLKTAGIGAAVANATASTKAIANYCCNASYTDGVLEAIRKFVLVEEQ